ncbi:hypothetical protein BofuT4_P086560.1 [Botrytis cinerea T4]|uniref:Uncharacterized protein n=1 Tax=Botryotinia fuckeliana (strain T4) TaxID=999810 RepID=G2YGH9_BOTF4|nr:hypothetical protein BofuT4_P086560.1 [Botrytis cinerea T4]
MNQMMGIPVAILMSSDPCTIDFSIVRATISSGAMIILRENNFAAIPFHRGGDGDGVGEAYLIFVCRRDLLIEVLNRRGAIKLPIACVLKGTGRHRRKGGGAKNISRLLFGNVYRLSR